MASPLKRTRPRRVLEFYGFESPVHEILRKGVVKGRRYTYHNMDYENRTPSVQREKGIIRINGRQGISEFPYKARDGKPIRPNTIDEFHAHMPGSELTLAHFTKFANELNRILRPGGKAYFTTDEGGLVLTERFGYGKSENAIANMELFAHDPRFRIRFAWAEGAHQLPESISKQKPHFWGALSLAGKFSNFWEHAQMVLVIQKRRNPATPK